MAGPTGLLVLVSISPLILSIMLFQVDEAGIQLSDLRTNDTASYSVSVRLSDAQTVATQTADLLVAGRVQHV